jgi:hypothetical protein
MNRKKTIGNNQPKQMSRQYYTQKEKEKKRSLATHYHSIVDITHHKKKIC